MSLAKNKIILGISITLFSAVSVQAQYKCSQLLSRLNSPVVETKMTRAEAQEIASHMGLEGGEAFSSRDWKKFISQIDQEGLSNDFGKAYKEALRRHEYLFSHTDPSDLFHGASSDLLSAFIKINNSEPVGMKPTSELPRIPYGGEFQQGAMKDGVNSKSLSVAASFEVDYAISYAQANKWDPVSAQQSIEQTDKDLKGYRYKKKTFPSGEVFYSVDDMMFFQNKVEKQRLKQWNKLSDIEKDLIQKSFPVFVAVKMRPDQYVVNFLKRNGKDFEQALIGDIKPSQLRAIFVPKNKIEFVKKLLSETIPDVPVLELEPITRAKKRL